MYKNFMTKKQYREAQTKLTKQFLELVEKQIRFSEKLLKLLETKKSPKIKAEECVKRLQNHLAEIQEEIKWFQKKLDAVYKSW